MLRKITLINYRTCKKSIFECHPQLSVLIGPNSCGKTNILQGILFLNKMVGEVQRYPYDTVNVTSSIRALFSVGYVRADLSASIFARTDDSNNDDLALTHEKLRLTNKKGNTKLISTPLSAGLGYHISANNYNYRSYVAHMHGRQLGMKYNAPYIGNKDYPSWCKEAHEDLFKFCFGMRYYSASQFTNPGSCPVSIEIEEDPEGRGLPRRPWRFRGHSLMLYNMYKMYIAPRKKGSSSFTQFMDIVGPLGLGLIDKIKFKVIKTSSVDLSVLVGGQIQKKRVQKALIVPQFKRGNQVLSPNQLSEGTFKTIALLFNIITDDSTALLIEEPEVCVHQGLLSSILKLIKQYSDQKQMIVTTHSDYVLEYVKPENVFTVKYTKKLGTEIHQIKRTMSVKEYSALRHYLENEGNLGDYWREGSLEGDLK